MPEGFSWVRLNNGPAQPLVEESMAAAAHVLRGDPAKRGGWKSRLAGGGATAQARRAAEEMGAGEGEQAMREDDERRSGVATSRKGSPACGSIAAIPPPTAGRGRSGGASGSGSAKACVGWRVEEGKCPRGEVVTALFKAGAPHRASSEETPASHRKRKAGPTDKFAAMLLDIKEGRYQTKCDLRGSYLTLDRLSDVCCALVDQDGASTTRLDLQGCQIGNDGLKIIVDRLLTKDSNLLWIDLGLNGITDDGADHVLRAFPRVACTKLAYMDLKENFIGQDMQKKLQDAKKQCPCLETLDLNRNSEMRERGTERASRKESVVSLSLGQFKEGRLNRNKKSTQDTFAWSEDEGSDSENVGLNGEEGDDRVESISRVSKSCDGHQGGQSNGKDILRLSAHSLSPVTKKKKKRLSQNNLWGGDAGDWSDDNDLEDFVVNDASARFKKGHKAPNLLDDGGGPSAGRGECKPRSERDLLSSVGTVAPPSSLGLSHQGATAPKPHNSSSSCQKLAVERVDPLQEREVWSREMCDADDADAEEDYMAEGHGFARAHAALGRAKSPQGIARYFAAQEGGGGEGMLGGMIHDEAAGEQEIESVPEGGFIPRDTALEALINGLPLRKWELPNFCGCDGECPVRGHWIEQGSTEKEIVLCVEGSFARCKESMTKLRGGEGAEVDKYCVLAFFDRITKLGQRSECGKPVGLAVLRGLKELLMDNGYIGHHLTTRPDWSLVYANLLAASFHWVYHASQKVSAQSGLGVYENPADKCLMEEYSVEAHCKRTLKVLLYLLDKGVEGAPDMMSVASLRAKEGKDYVMEGASVQMEMMLQVWAELAAVASKPMQSKTGIKMTARYWEYLQSCIDQVCRRYNAALACNIDTLPSQSPPPSASARSMPMSDPTRCDASQSWEFKWCALIVSTLVCQARGTPIPAGPSSPGSKVEGLIKDVKASPLSTSFSPPAEGLFALGKLFKKGTKIVDYELAVLERCRAYLIRLNNMHIDGQASGGQGSLIVGKLWEWCTSLPDPQHCTAHDVRHFTQESGAVVADFDYAIARASGAPYPMCRAVLALADELMRQSPVLRNKLVSTLYASVPRDKRMVVFAGLASQYGGGGGHVHDICSMLAMVFRHLKEEDGWGCGGDRRWTDSWNVLLRVGNWETPAHCLLEILEKSVSLEQVNSDIVSRKSVVSVMRAFAQASFFKGFDDKTAIVSRQLMTVLEISLQEVSKLTIEVEGRGSWSQERARMAEDFLVWLLGQIHVVVSVCGGGVPEVGQAMKKVLTDGPIARISGGGVVSAALKVLDAMCTQQRDCGAGGNPQTLRFAWIALREYLVAMYKDKPCGRLEGSVRAVHTCATVANTLRSLPQPSVGFHESIMRMFDPHHSDFASKSSSAARAIPTLFYAEFAAQAPAHETDSANPPDDIIRAVNAWILCSFDNAVYHVPGRINTSVLVIAADLLSSSKSPFLKRLMARVSDKMKGVNGDNRIPALQQFADNGANLMANGNGVHVLFAKVFDGLYKCIQARMAETLIQKQHQQHGSVHSSTAWVGQGNQRQMEYLAFAMEALRVLMPPFAKAIHGALLHDLCKFFVRRPDAVVLNDPHLRGLWMRLIRATLQTVAQLNLDSGIGHVKVAKIATACVHMKLLDDCSDTGGVRTQVSNRLLSLVSLFPDPTSMRNVLRHVFRCCAMDLLDDDTSNPRIKRIMRACALVQELAKDVYLSRCSQAQVFSRAQQFLEDASCVFGVVVAGSTNTSVKKSHFQIVRGLLACFREAGLMYNEVLEMGNGELWKRFVQWAQMDALSRALEALLKLLKWSEGGSVVGWREEKGHIGQTKTQIDRMRHGFKTHFCNEEERLGCGLSELERATYRSKKTPLVPDQEWWVANRDGPMLVGVASLLDQGVEISVVAVFFDALDLVTSCFLASDSTRMPLLQVLSKGHEAVCEVLLRIKANDKLRQCEECAGHWQNFLKRLGPPGAVYLAKLHDLGPQDRDAEEVQESVLWLDRAEESDGMFPQRPKSCRRRA